MLPASASPALETPPACGPFRTSVRDAVSEPVHEAVASGGALVCTANYPANQGFAWTFLEDIIGRVGEAFAARGVPTYVAYPAVPSAPTALEGRHARPLTLNLTSSSPRAFLAALGTLRRLRARVVYLTDVRAVSWRFPLLRLAGVRWIVAHQYSVGTPPPNTRLKRLLKRVRAALPWLWADVLITCSDFVAASEQRIALTPARRTVRVWNGMPAVDLGAQAANRASVRRELGIDDDGIVVFTGSRASRQKGIIELLHAFEKASQQWPRHAPGLYLVFAGDGPDLELFRSLAREQTSADHILLLGRRSDIPRLIDAADMIAMPSTCADALPLAVLEGMSHGKPVIGTTVGGIPEMVRHEQEGLLVPPGNVDALAAAILRLASEPALWPRFGERARERALREFSLESMVTQTVAQVARGLPTVRG